MMHMISLGNYNRSAKYVLVCIDILLRYAWIQAVKSNESSDVIETFKRILQQGRQLAGRQVVRLNSIVSKWKSILCKKIYNTDNRNKRILCRAAHKNNKWSYL